MPDPNDTESTQTDTWTTSQSKSDSTQTSTLPKAVADEVDGKDHTHDVAQSDDGGRVFDKSAAEANRG